LPAADARDPSIADLVEPASALLVGPGLEHDAPAVAGRLAAHLAPTVPLLLDARALSAAEDLAPRGLVLLPNVDEGARLVGSTEEPPGEPADIAAQLATALRATVAVRGTESVVTNGDRTWTSSGHPGLGTAGSGDVLAGLVVGLIARGVCPLPALGWAISVHAAAGALASEGGPGYGYLARDLLDRVPAALASLRGEPVR
jgi:ADP-dependent NAD(P)H-hydrate dehydratase